jgi:positive regulator of sigma E activity
LVKKGTKRLLVNSALLLVIFLFAQMLVPDFVALGLLFNVPKETLIYVAVFGMVGAIVITVWYNKRTEKAH